MAPGAMRLRSCARWAAWAFFVPKAAPSAPRAASRSAALTAAGGMPLSAFGSRARTCSGAGRSVVRPVRLLCSAM
jgi:hypothetical protein